MTLFIELTIWFFYFTVGACVFSFALPRITGCYIHGFFSNKYCSGFTGGILSLMCLNKFGFSWEFNIAFIMVLILSAVTAVDYFTMKIPDNFVFVTLLCGVLSVFVFPEIPMHSKLIGFFAVSVPLLIISIITKGSFGGGDIKFMAACGLFLGWETSIYAIFIASLAGGVFGSCVLLSRKLSRKDSIAFGPFLCLGAAVVLLTI